MTRRVVLVSGAPGSGKTTLARPLAAALGFALLSKDDIKETLHDALEAPEGDLAASRRLGGASMEVMWTLALRCPAVVLEANFLPRSEYTRERLTAICPSPVEIYCHCPPEESRRRFAERAKTAHPTHFWRELPTETLAQYDAPLALGSVIAVDTTQPVDLRDVVSRTRQALSDAA